ncbi:MAG: DNA-3-methyladenine glycosylase 2, partial [Candidatus Omnitrophica bacterium]|nr:DNA-3-methyladenine glycosylase 2 [Candidatus Omnitrophota bacterium]
FIISSNNNIKRIQGIRRSLARNFTSSEFVFPLAQSIARSDEATLRKLGLGYRAPFLLAGARILARGRELLDKIRKADYQEAKACLLKFPGVGEKVADCVLLFGFQNYEAFPVDIWIYRAMKKLYFRNREVSEKRIREFAQRRWGKYAGYIQQYVYHGARKGVI